MKVEVDIVTSDDIKIYYTARYIIKYIHSSLIMDYCFDDSYVGQQPVIWKEYCTEYLFN